MAAILAGKSGVNDVWLGTQLVTRQLYSKLKRVGLGHALAQAVRPRSVLAHITVGRGIKLDHVFGSRWLIDQLYSLGFCISYDETSLFKQSVMQDDREGILQSGHCEYSADNADCNLDTVTGAGTFHGVGVIRCSRRTTDARESENRIRRLAGVSVSHLADQKGIGIETYVPHEQLSTIRELSVSTH